VGTIEMKRPLKTALSMKETFAVRAPHHPLTRLLRCGLVALAYATPVFLAGCAIGTFRLVFVAPRVGGTWAVIMELPVILGISWYASRLSCRLFPARNFADTRLIGAFAFLLLMSAEWALDVAVFRRSPVEHVALYLTVAGALGLTGQLMFAMLPLLQLKLRKRG
jgi:hypothetical protein